jgi:plastocyanin
MKYGTWVTDMKAAAIFCLLAAPFGFAAAGDLAFKVIDQKKGLVADAVVSLVPLDRTAVPMPPAAARRIDIAQIARQFEPYITVVRVGTTVRFPNNDGVQHHVYSLSPAKKFEMPLHKPGRADSVVFDQTGVVAVGCNIHDWMSAYVVVVDSPWFAVTLTDGVARIPGVPPGRYRAEIWHPRMAALEKRELAVADAAAAVTLELPLKPGFRNRPAPPDAGGVYKP